MNKLRIISILFFCLFLFSCGVKKEKIVCYGDAHSNLAQLLTDEEAFSAIILRFRGLHPKSTISQITHTS